ncbi:MAG: hypothetical protein ACE5GO_07200, partial [Anaerolineales bacterium]
MLPLYLTPTALSNLTICIFVGFMAGYLWVLAHRARQAGRQLWRTIYLAGAFSAIAAYVLLTFLEDVLYPDLGFYVLPPRSVAMTFGMVWLVQFAYHFPALLPDRGREARLALWLTLLLPPWEAYYAIYRYARLAQGVVQFRPPRVDYVVAAVFVWFLVVLLRQVGRADQRLVPLWRKLWRPQGSPARAARAFTLVGLTPLWAMAVIILRNDFGLSNSAAAVLLSLGMLVGFLAFALVYLNFLPERTSFMVKLVAISLVIVLGILGTVGHLISPDFIRQYHNPNFIADHQTLHFAPNAQGGYDVTRIPFRMEEDLGKRLDSHTQWMTLAFDFPFYNRVWREVFLDKNIGVIFGETFDLHDSLFRYGSRPAIFPLGVDSVSLNLLEGPSGLFAHNSADRLIVTWYQMPEADAAENRYTLRLALYPNGTFDITFDGLPETLAEWIAANGLT